MWCNRTKLNKAGNFNYLFSLTVMKIIVRLVTWKAELRSLERGNQAHCSAVYVELSSTTGNFIVTVLPWK